ncbi:MAG: hypothetical protein HQL15_07495 [Candidatus Omnitrophica bacterium]|nr:hypothetical protein [Candidatus Omnitrophota bacterium]
MKKAPLFHIVILVSFLWTFVRGESLSLMGAIFLMGGLQLIAIGIIGEYVWYGLKESRRRPLFFIERRSR